MSSTRPCASYAAAPLPVAGFQPARLPTVTLTTQQTGGYAASARDPLPVAHLLCSGQHNVPHSRCATQIIHPDAQSYLCASVFRVYTATARQPPRRVDKKSSSCCPRTIPIFLLVAASRWTPSRTSSSLFVVLPSTQCAPATALAEHACPTRPAGLGAIAFSHPLPHPLIAAHMIRPPYPPLSLPC